MKTDEEERDAKLAEKLQRLSLLERAIFLVHANVMSLGEIENGSDGFDDLTRGRVFAKAVSIALGDYSTDAIVEALGNLVKAGVFEGPLLH